MNKAKILISGDVQGVFFRFFVRDKAEVLGLNGFVKNRGDKKVEVVVEGHELKIKKLIEECRVGPKGASVENIEVHMEPFKNEFSKFRIKY